ncbi:MAG: protein phosphatase CheZ [Deltaproteobacteria bacterium]|nr:protein phosphatase CheZ [Deltaproteobacteria bacterium]
MGNVLMGDLDGLTERLAFDTHEIEQIITRYKARIVSGSDDNDYMEFNGRIFPVKGLKSREEIKPYFIVLKSGEAFNASDYQLLFNTEDLSNSLVSGVDSSGKKYLCRRYGNGARIMETNIQKYAASAGNQNLTLDETEKLKDVINKLKKGEFFELLTMEFSDKIKGIAKELIDFRKDIQTKIEPDIVELASKDIPEASNQLEGINETLEESTMKIMDINEAQMEAASAHYRFLEQVLSKNSDVDGDIVMGLSLEEAIDTIENQISFLKEMEQRSLTMMEPLSFQDLVGQRIQRIIRLVRSMEIKIEELIVSFGIKLKKYKEDPEITYEELNKDVDEYMYELKGPQRSGEGLDQKAIDDLLNNL